MDSRRFDVVGLGQCSLDVLVTIDVLPPPDSKCEYDDRLVQGGGPVGTALVALARWGLTAAIAGVIGDDDLGAMIRTSLDVEGVDTKGLVVRTGETSQFAFVAAEPRAGHRTIFWRRPTGTSPGSGELDLDAVRTARVFHTDGLYPEASLAACAAAQEAGVTVVVDAGTLREGMLEIAARSDYFVASETFSRQLVGRDDPAEACRRLAGLGPRVAGVTLGSRGYVARVDGRTIERSAYRVEVVDTTGCGDVFHAGLTYGTVRGWGVETSLDFGAWAAAMAARSLGGRSAIPDVADYPGTRA